MTDPRFDLVAKAIRDVPDFPKPGILFKDITPLFADRHAFAAAIDLFCESITPLAPDVLVGIESRGFWFAPAIALRLGCAFVPARKPGKLPRATLRAAYALEYGTDALEIHADAVAKGARVVVVDDVLATGGTAHAAASLVHSAEASVVGYAFLIELAFLGARARLGSTPVTSLVTVE